MPCLASFFDALFGVKKLANFVPAINYPTSAFEPSILTPHSAGRRSSTSDLMAALMC